MNLHKSEQQGIYESKVDITSWVSDTGEHMVTIAHCAGPMSFHFHLSPEQALELAGKIAVAADAVKPVEVAA